MKTLIAILVSTLIGITTIQAQWVTQTVPANVGLIRYIDIIDPNTVWVVSNGIIGSSTSVNILRTTDGGNNWYPVTVNVPGVSGTYSVYSLEALDANIAYAVIALDNPGLGPATMLCKTIDSGQTWSLIPGIFTSQASWANFVQFFDMNNGLAFGDNQEIYTTNNGGNTWTAVPRPNLPLPSGDDYSLDRRTALGNTIWVPVGGMRIYISTDKGLHWTVSNTNIPVSFSGSGPVVMGLAFQDANNGLASHGNSLSRTTDGGLTWTPVNYSGKFFIHGITHITGSPNSYVSFSVLNNDPGFSITHDNGLTWTQLDNSAHMSAAFINNRSGWSGGNGVMYKLNGNTLSINKESEEASFAITPNPTNGIFTLSDPGLQLNSIVVYNTTGIKVFQASGKLLGRDRIDLSGHPKGVYIVQILTNGQRITRKLVLQ